MASKPASDPIEPCLDKMPTELMIMIAKDLGFEDLCALRGCCSDLRNGLYDYFDSKFFRQQNAVIDNNLSLKRLLHISEHEWLGPKV